MLAPSDNHVQGAARLLTAEEEQALAGRIASGDEEAVQELVLRNLRLARWLAGRMDPGHREDAEQDGYLGLTEAARRFRPGRGRFTTYADYWIRLKIGRGRRRRASMIRIPDYLAGKVQPPRRIPGGPGSGLLEELPGPSPEDRPDRAEIAGRLRSAAARGTPAERRTLEALAACDGDTTRAADRLGITPDTIRRQLSGLRRRLVTARSA
jgi:RNA polymerase sigma factor (sigma-70 family)